MPLKHVPPIFWLHQSPTDIPQFASWHSPAPLVLLSTHLSHLCLPSPLAGSAILSGSTTGTYYYDMVRSCPNLGPGNAEFSDMNQGYTICESYTPGPNQRTLAQRNTNNIIAIGQLFGANPATRALYCGKQIKIFRNGVPIAAPSGGDFYVWDGCQACHDSNGGRVDFSLSGLQGADAQACTDGVVPGITYTITTVQTVPFNP